MDQPLDDRDLGRDVGAAQEQQVATGPQRLHARLRYVAVPGNRTHLHVVGGDKSLEAELRPQQISHYGLRQRGGPFLVERGVPHVRRHQHRYLRVDRRTKRRQLHLVESWPLLLHYRQILVRIDRSVAMPWKVLAAGRDSLVLQSPYNDCAELTGPRCVHRHRPVANHRIRRVRVNIQHRRIVERNPDGAQFPGQGAGKILRQLRVAVPPPDRRSPRAASPAPTALPRTRAPPPAAARRCSARRKRRLPGRTRERGQPAPQEWSDRRSRRRSTARSGAERLWTSGMGGSRWGRGRCGPSL